MGSDRIRLIDVQHLGHDRVIGAWLIDDVLVDPGPASCLDTLIEGLGGFVPRALALTHIHLDHGGASGVLCRRWPGLEVWVHERGARHLVDPERLLASAGRLYGDQMERLWGEVAPVPQERLRTLSGGERIGPFEVAYTPGHASHHVAYLDADDGVVFAGDSAGVRIPPAGPVIAPTPPPDIDLQLWAASIAKLRRWRPQRLALAHFGIVDDPDEHLDALEQDLRRASAIVRVGDEAAYLREQRALYALGDQDRYEQAVPPDQSWSGLARHLAGSDLPSVS